MTQVLSTNAEPEDHTRSSRGLRLHQVALALLAALFVIVCWWVLEQSRQVEVTRAQVSGVRGISIDLEYRPIVPEHVNDAALHTPYGDDDSSSLYASYLPEDTIHESVDLGWRRSVVLGFSFLPDCSASSSSSSVTAYLDTSNGSRAISARIPQLPRLVRSWCGAADFNVELTSAGASAKEGWVTATYLMSSTDPGSYELTAAQWDVEPSVITIEGEPAEFTIRTDADCDAVGLGHIDLTLTDERGTTTEKSIGSPAGFVCE